jgi:hypothetical protein
MVAPSFFAGAALKLKSIFYMLSMECLDSGGGGFSMIYQNWRWLVRSLALLLSALPVAVWGQASPNPKLVEAQRVWGRFGVRPEY